VRSFVRETLHESYVLRAALEETATRLVLMAGSVPFDQLQDDVRRMHDAAQDGDTERVGRESVMFHRHIIEAAGNDLIKRTWEDLHIEARTPVTIMATSQSLDEIANDHQALLDSLSADAIEAACDLARQHQWNYSELPHDVSSD
jgi:DNA-binding GntR family transcriptional regulator